MHEPRIFIWTNESSNYKENGIDTGCNRQVDIRYRSSHDDRYFSLVFTFDKYICYDIFTLITVHTILASAQCFETWLQHWMKLKISPCFWNQWPAIFRYIRIHNYNWLSYIILINWGLQVNWIQDMTFVFRIWRIVIFRTLFLSYVLWCTAFAWSILDLHSITLPLVSLWLCRRLVTC